MRLNYNPFPSLNVDSLHILIYVRECCGWCLCALDDFILIWEAVVYNTVVVVALILSVVWVMIQLIIIRVECYLRGIPL